MRLPSDADWYAQHSYGRVVLLRGVAAMSEHLDPLPAGAPAIVEIGIAPIVSSAQVVATVLDGVESAARHLFPLWLPGGEDLDGPNRLDLQAARTLATDLASTTDNFGPFVASLAESALFGRPIRRQFIARTRAEGLRRVIAAAYERHAVAVLVRVDPQLPAEDHAQLVSGCEWLADQGGFTVWVVGPPELASDRVRAVDVPGRKPSTATTWIDRTRHHVRIPAMAGRPHPGSAAEKKLERALSLCEWAAGREWNQPFHPSSLHERVVVDLRWPAEMCVVEVDGDEHRHAVKFARDRQRDVVLQLHGYAVLRFTNADILDDVAAVVSAIEIFIKNRRDSIPRTAHTEGTPSGR